MQEAYYIFQELGEKYTWTVLLMNGSAVCQMHMGHFEEAESRLLEALNKVKLKILCKCGTPRSKSYGKQNFVTTTQKYSVSWVAMTRDQHCVTVDIGFYFNSKPRGFSSTMSIWCSVYMFNITESQWLQDSKDANTLANLIVCSLHMGKPTVRHMRYDTLVHYFWMGHLFYCNHRVLTKRKASTR